LTAPILIPRDGRAEAAGEKRARSALEEMGTTANPPAEAGV